MATSKKSVGAATPAKKAPAKKAPAKKTAPKVYGDLMVDLETLGTVPGSALLSVGAVFFSPEKGLGDTFYKVIRNDGHQQDEYGLVTDPDTEAWWKRQSTAARAVFKDASKLTKSSRLEDVLAEFLCFVQLGGSANVQVWGNGSDFDNAMLAVAYRRIGLNLPWKFWNSRCFRTLKNLYPDVPRSISGELVAHNALDDAVSQAQHAIDILRHMHGTAK